MTLAERACVQTLVVLVMISCVGCTGDLVDLTGNKNDASVVQDLTPPPSGEGGTLVPKFDPDINADIIKLGCTAGSCHGGTQVPVLKMDAASIGTNYTNFKDSAMAGESSPVLTENLAGDPNTHGGGKFFPNKQDATYVKWLAWINAGNPEK